jgi:hypothetical protein
MDDTALRRTLERHGGIITLAEARAAGLSAAMVSDRVWSRRWRRVGPRTYVVAGHRWTDETRARAHERNPARSGAAAAGRLLDAASDRAGSEADQAGSEAAWVLLLRLLRRPGLPGLRRGYRTFGHELSVAFPASRVAVEVEVEVDGGPWHHDAERFTSDRVRQEVLVAAGWTVLRYTWHQLQDEPDRVHAEIADAVRRGLVSRPVVERP